jgi:Fe-S cluster assembly protein SufD
MNDTAANLMQIRELWTERFGDDAGWLGQKRQDAINMFEQLGFPDRSQEAWRYADLRKLAGQFPVWLGNLPTLAADPTDTAIELGNCSRLVFVDGRFSEQLSDTLPDGIFAGTAQELARHLPELAARQWGAQAHESESGFISLNSAFGDSTVAIDVPAGATLDKPLHLLFAGSTAESVTIPRILINLGTGAQATVLENYLSAQPRIVNAVTEINCAAGSHLHYYKLQEDAAGSWYTAAQYISLARDAQVDSTHIDIGAACGRNELTVKLTEPNSEARCNGVFVADESIYVENRINIEHLAPHTTSRERFRGILAGKAKGVFNGRIFVAREAQKTAAELSNRNLLLDSGAEINTKPELEIYADDVKCAHGATTGQLDAQSMFYLLSRGIPPAEARSMLIQAFASELVLELGMQALSTRVQDRLQALGSKS